MRKILSSISIMVVVVLTVGMMVLAIPGGMVSAKALQDDPESSLSTSDEGQVKSRLEKRYDHLQDLILKQEKNISRLDDLIQKTQQRIDTLTGQGLDTSALQSALTAFEAKLPEIQNEHDAAGDILTVHAGFGADGSVTDIDSAHSTLLSARKALQSTRSTMRTSLSELRQAFRDFRAANPRDPSATEASPAD
jgi:hypothetical protein